MGKKNLKILVKLVHKYETPLFVGDYSSGFFLEGHVKVNTQEELDQIQKRFEEEGLIDLHENTDKYLSEDSYTEDLRTINIKDLCSCRGISNPESYQHIFGKGWSGTTEGGYKYYYWLQVWDYEGN